MKVLGVLTTGLLMLAAGARAWGEESQGGATPAEAQEAPETQAPAQPAAAAAAEAGDEAAAPGSGEPTAREQAAPSAPAAAVEAEPPAAPAESAPAASVPAGRVVKPRGAGEDRKIAKEIQGAFAKDPDLKNNRIDVTVDHCNTDDYSTNCYVSLAGAVDTQPERMKAEQFARVKGVVLVDNLLDLSDDAKEGIADGELTAKVREHLLSDATFKDAIISISTTNGVVRLVGTVPSEAVRRQAGEKARKSSAVKRVENALQVEPGWQPRGRKSAVSQPQPGVAAR